MSRMDTSSCCQALLQALRLAGPLSAEAYLSDWLQPRTMWSSARSRMSHSRSKRDSSAAGSAMFSLGERRVSYRPHAGLAAASTCGTTTRRDEARIKPKLKLSLPPPCSACGVKRKASLWCACSASW